MDDSDLDSLTMEPRGAFHDDEEEEEAEGVVVGIFLCLPLSPINTSTPSDEILPYFFSTISYVSIN
jgi:hypothetical protein